MKQLRLIAVSVVFFATGCQLLGGGGDDQAGEGLFELKIELPKATSGAQGMETVLAVAISPDGKLYLNGIEVNEASLEKIALEERGKNPKIKAVIYADKDVRYQKVVEIIDVLIKSGIHEVSLGVEPAGPLPKSEPLPASRSD